MRRQAAGLKSATLFRGQAQGQRRQAASAIEIRAQRPNNLIQSY